MSTQLIDHNEDLKKLKDEGFNISLINQNIVIKGIPYINKEKKILFGTIFCPFTLSGEKTVLQQDHTVRFSGEHPCDQFGKEDNSYVNSQQTFPLTQDIVGTYYFSSKPESGSYPNFYIKIKRYVNLLSAPAKSIDPGVTAQNFDYNSYNEDSVFKYPDTNTARAGFSHVSEKLKGQKIAIVGLGGTGSFVLDFVSKTPVKQISLFDGDFMYNHNAFRIPGVMSEEELSERPSKVSFFEKRYEKLRDGIITYEVFLDDSNVNLLEGHDFVFLTLDKAEAKKAITEFLMTSKIPFVDLGMGLTLVGDSIRGTIRKTLITPENSSSLNKIAIGPAADNDVYAQNIQISELNALNAALGIIAWKKMNEFYLYENTINNSTFIIDVQKDSYT
ncbi:ThiF family adenylyltransferase [Fictibacillus phosphorivorans]|uniref:ThiF family adenylyltransferase n=1 Tax=Fictibacillus phosphorivorans TaxID=1221500 RepID=UPI002040CB2F|nr:ThiF family adenylyltransferase [Fictibacillus phosphorivorans]MCM3719438.1 ThiF family adenylyltransferase [Fictibacillus phosphorivorans]MCM3777084.1 ThiF family adenylyltransferase [Fictibacillus phosphorivorans]